VWLRFDAKTTLEIPGAIFRRAKSKAAERGIPLRQFVTEAAGGKLKNSSSTGEKPGMTQVGKLKHLHKEIDQMDQAVEDAFEKIDPEIWVPESQDRFWMRMPFPPWQSKLLASTRH
jgi:hypothetical protein